MFLSPMVMGSSSLPSLNAKHLILKNLKAVIYTFSLGECFWLPTAGLSEDKNIHHKQTSSDRDNVSWFLSFEHNVPTFVRFATTQNSGHKNKKKLDFSSFRVFRYVPAFVSLDIYGVTTYKLSFYL